MDWIEPFCLSPRYLSMIAMVHSIRSPASVAVSLVQCLSFRPFRRPSICYKLQYSVVATNCPQSPPKLKLLLKYLQCFYYLSISSVCYKLQYSVVATNCPQSPPKLKLLLKYLQCFYYLSISSAVYTKVEDTAVVISGTINNLDLSDASKAGVALLQPVAVLVVPLEY